MHFVWHLIYGVRLIFYVDCRMRDITCCMRNDTHYMYCVMYVYTTLRWIPVKGIVLYDMSLYCACIMVSICPYTRFDLRIRRYMS